MRSLMKRIFEFLYCMSTFTLLKVDIFFVKPYHPQADGQSERTSQRFRVALRNQLARMNWWAEASVHP